MISSRASCWVVRNPLGHHTYPLENSRILSVRKREMRQLGFYFFRTIPLFLQNKNRLVDLLKNRVRLQRLTVKPNPSKSNCLNPCPVRKNIAILGIDSDRSHLWINFPPDRKPCSSACWFDDLKTWKKLRRHRCNDPRDLCSVANYNVRSTRNVYMPPTPPHPTPPQKRAFYEHGFRSAGINLRLAVVRRDRFLGRITSPGKPRLQRRIFSHHFHHWEEELRGKEHASTVYEMFMMHDGCILQRFFSSLHLSSKMCISRSHAQWVHLKSMTGLYPI